MNSKWSVVTDLNVSFEQDCVGGTNEWTLWTVCGTLFGIWNDDSNEGKITNRELHLVLVSFKLNELTFQSEKLSNLCQV